MAKCSSSSMGSTEAREPSQGAWSTGLCDCFDDIDNCCTTCWCPCITFGRIAEIIDQGENSAVLSAICYVMSKFLCCCGCIVTTLSRMRLRELYDMPDSPGNDCFVHCCCEYCALCQEYRELKLRGFDMKIGWHANVENQTAGVTDYPKVGPRMIR